MIAIIDYDAGNIRSVEKAVQFLGEDAILTRDPGIIFSADKVILPGVGCFKDAMDNLRKYGLIEVIHEVVTRNIPFLGICLGLQLLYESSEESPGVSGLGILKGTIKKIPSKEGLKIPHMGWNSLEFPNRTKLCKGLERNAYVYFVHSYYLEAADISSVAATTEYSVLIHAAVESGNIYACQFHPEKSSDVGMKVLKNFLEV